MRIANPIYDVVFKYLLEDNQIARLILSTILGEDVIELEFRPQERVTEITERHLTVYRLDFAATIRNSRNEYRQVLIEIQKAKFEADIMRFRRYLGTQYRDTNNSRMVALRKRALPIVTIYFLGHSLEYSKAPVIRVSRICEDLTTGEGLTEKEYFIESLTHDCYIIQIPHLRPERRSELDQMLRIFDQQRVHADKHILEIDEKEIPECYRPILRRLQRAIAEQKVIDAMDIEDEILEELQDLEREKEQERVEKERERAEKEQERAAKEQALAEKEQERAEKERERAEKEQALAEKEIERAEKERLLKLLRSAGLNPDDV